MPYRFAIIQRASRTKVLADDSNIPQRIKVEEVILELSPNSIKERLLDKIHRKLPRGMSKKVEPAVKAAWEEIQEELKRETIKYVA